MFHGVVAELPVTGIEFVPIVTTVFFCYGEASLHLSCSLVFPHCGGGTSVIVVVVVMNSSVYVLS